MYDNRVKFITFQEPADFLKLRKAWEELSCSLDSETTVFATPVWYENWWKHYGKGKELYLFTMWQEDRIVGIAPLMRSDLRLHGFRVKSIGFIQNNQALHNDFIVSPRFRESFFENLLLSLFEQASLWDVLYLRNVSPEAKNQAFFQRVLDHQRRSWRIRRNDTDSPYLLPDGSWQDFLKKRTKRTQKSIRNICNRMEKAGQVLVKHVSTWDEYLACREDLFAVAQLSWAESVKDSLGSSANKEFYDSLSRDAAIKGWLSIWLLYLDDVAIAVEYHLKAFGREHALRGHYHPGFAALSPGTYLESRILESVFEGVESVKIYEFPGGFDSYKKKWSERSSPHADVFVFRESFVSALVLLYEFRIIPGLKSAIGKMKSTRRRVATSTMASVCV